MLIVVEGMDASGKATLTKALADSIPNAVRLSFPEYGTVVGQAILEHLQGKWCAANKKPYDFFDGWTKGELREYLNEEEFNIPHLSDGDNRLVSKYDALVLQCLMTVNRLELVPLIHQFLKMGQVVILDRYWHSGVVYGSMDGNDPDWLEMIHCTLPRPQLSLLVDIPAAVSLERRPERRDRYEARGLEWFDQVRARYLNFWRQKQAQGQEYVIMDGTQSADQVLEWAKDEIARVAKGIMLQQERKTPQLVLPYTGRLVQ